MLVLACKKTQRIILKIKGMPDIIITAVRTQNDNMYIGIDAVQDVQIYREQVLHRMIATGEVQA